MSKKRKAIKPDVLKYLLGKEKAQLLRYCQKHPSFYQAEVAHDLHWSISATQYHLTNFVKNGLLSTQPTSYKTYYKFNPVILKTLFDNCKCTPKT